MLISCRAVSAFAATTTVTIAATAAIQEDIVHGVSPRPACGTGLPAPSDVSERTGQGESEADDFNGEGKIGEAPELGRPTASS